MEENNAPKPSGDSTPKSQAKPAENKESKPVKKKKMKTSQIITIILVALVIVLPTLVYFIKGIEISNLTEKYQKQTDSIRAATADELVKKDDANVMLVARVFSWAVRAELLRDNQEQAGQIMIDLAKNANYKQITLVASDGKVLISTDKAEEGKVYSENFYQQLAGSDEVQVSTHSSGDKIVAAPVYGIGSRVGSVVILYRPIVYPGAAVKEKKE